MKLRAFVVNVTSNTLIQLSNSYVTVYKNKELYQNIEAFLLKVNIKNPTNEDYIKLLENVQDILKNFQIFKMICKKKKNNLKRKRLLEIKK